jgi:DNA-binding CsgD family transcriptional regulator
LIAVDAKHRIVTWSDGAKKIFGLSAHETKGRQLGDVLTARDAFGNELCPDGCWLHEMARRNEPVNAFVMEVNLPEDKTIRLWVRSRVTNIGNGRADYRLDLSLRKDRRRIDGILLNHHNNGADRPGPTKDDSPRLTHRQRGVLRLVADGHNTSAIAEQLGISPNTVRNHVQNALRALDTHHLPAAVAIALRRGLI